MASSQMESPESLGKWGGVFVFVRSLQHALKNAEAARCVIVWDSGLSERRKKLYPAYKGHRHAAEPQQKDIDFRLNLNLQQTYLKEILPLMGLAMISIPGREGDDLLWCAREVGRGLGLTPTVIISEDKDFYQMIDDTTVVYHPVKKQYVSRDNFEEVMGIQYGRAILHKALLGDKSDNITGVPGVGDKTVREIVLNVESTDWDVIEKYCASHKSTRVQKVASNMSIVKRNYEMVCLGLEVFTEEEQRKIENTITTPVASNFDEVLRTFMLMEFRSLTKYFTEWMVPFVSIGAKWNRAARVA